MKNVLKYFWNNFWEGPWSTYSIKFSKNFEKFPNKIQKLLKNFEEF